MSSKKRKPSSQKSKSPTAVKSKPKRKAPSVPWHISTVDQLVELPRSWRILIVAVFSMAVVAAIFPLVDGIYLRLFYSPNTILVPALVTAACGVVMWGVGWWLLVGWAGEQPTARPAVLWYFIIGSSIVLLVVFLLVQGAVLGTADR